MVHEIIKERMLRELVSNIDDRFVTHNPHQALRDIYITNDENEDMCIPDKYMSDIIDESVYSKIDGLYDAISLSVDLSIDIQSVIQVDLEGDTTVIMTVGDNVVHRYAMKTWKWTWESIEDLQGFMLEILFELLLKLKQLQTKDEELELIYDIRKSTDFTRGIVERDGKHFLQYLEA